MRQAGIDRQFREEMVREHRDVFFTLTKRRREQRHHVQPVVQIQPKFAAAHRLIQIAIRRAHNPYIHGHALVAAHRNHDSLLDHTEQMGLESVVQFADFIDKNSAAVGGAEEAH